MLKIRRSHDSLIFNMGIPIPGKDGLYIETGHWRWAVTLSAALPSFEILQWLNIWVINSTDQADSFCYVARVALSGCLLWDTRYDTDRFQFWELFSWYRNWSFCINEPRITSGQQHFGLFISILTIAPGTGYCKRTVRTVTNRVFSWLIIVCERKILRNETLGDWSYGKNMSSPPPRFSPLEEM